jgi:hypothetical protein
VRYEQGLVTIESESLLQGAQRDCQHFLLRYDDDMLQGIPLDEE